MLPEVQERPLHNDYWDLEGVLESESAGRRTFLRFSFWANLLLRRFLSPGLRKNACFLTSLIMPSCCTCRLNRRRALSIDSPSKIRIAANACLPPLEHHPVVYRLHVADPRRLNNARSVMKNRLTRGTLCHRDSFSLTVPTRSIRHPWQDNPGNFLDRL